VPPMLLPKKRGKTKALQFSMPIIMMLYCNKNCLNYRIIFQHLFWAVSQNILFAA
jgi:hypothetical protein